MTTAMPRWIFLLLPCLALSGCSLSALNPAAAEEADLFTRGLDQYVASGELKTLKLVPQRYPQGEWRPRAEAIMTLAEQQRQQQARAEKAGQELELCQQELTHTQQDKTDLIRDNQMLEVTLERLKQVLIDMELRAK